MIFLSFNGKRKCQNTLYMTKPSHHTSSQKETSHYLYTSLIICAINSPHVIISLGLEIHLRLHHKYKLQGEIPHTYSCIGTFLLAKIANLFCLHFLNLHLTLTPWIFKEFKVNIFTLSQMLHILMDWIQHCPQLWTQQQYEKKTLQFSVAH